MQVWHLDSGYRYAGAFIFLIVIQWLAALGRVAVRTLVVKKFGWDDVALIFTLLVSTAFDALFLAVMYISNGGVRADRLPPGALVPAINITLCLLVLYIAGSSALKIACGMLLLRVLVRRWQVWTIYVAMLISTLYGIFFFFFILFQCGNPALFHTKIIFGQCLSRPAIEGTTFTHSVLMACIDLAFAALPVALIWGADMSRRSKVSVAVILGLGSVAVVATFVRLAYVHDLTKPTTSFLRTAQPITLLSAAELSIGVFCCSICTYKPFFHRYWGHQTSYAYDDETRVSQMRSPSIGALPNGHRPYSHYAVPTGVEVNRASTHGTPMWPLRGEKEVGMESEAVTPSSAASPTSATRHD